MNGTNCSPRIAAAGFVLVTIFLVAALVICQALPAAADDQLDANQLVEKARLTMEGFINDNDMGAFRDLLKQAEGVFIAPQLIKGAFIVGALGGNGVLLTRNKKNGKWSGPAFYTVGGASVGLQIGGQASEVVLLVMTERGNSSLLENSFKLGADAGIAAGPVGIGAAAATANLSADILSFSRSKGLYGGVSLEGAVVAVRAGLNNAYYGKEVSPEDILVRQGVRNPQALKLIETISKGANAKVSIRPMPREGQRG